MSEPKVMLVCGAGRSCTSGVASALHHGGWPMGSELMQPGPGNPDGYFEDLPAVKVNNQILITHGLTWHTVDAALEPTADTEWLIEVVHGYIATRCREAEGGQWGVKDPRLTVTMAYWLRALQRFDLEPIIVGVVRGTDAAARSLSTREGLGRLDAWRVTGVYQRALSVLALPPCA